MERTADDGGGQLNGGCAMTDTACPVVPAPASESPCSVYRLFDNGGRLLYVGISDDAVRRLREHTKKPWWGSVASVTWQVLDSRDEALKAELTAIRSERPVHNIVGRIAEIGQSLPPVQQRETQAATTVEVGRRDLARMMLMLRGSLERSEHDPPRWNRKWIHGLDYDRSFEALADAVEVVAGPNPRLRCKGRHQLYQFEDYSTTRPITSVLKYDGVGHASWWDSWDFVYSVCGVTGAKGDRVPKLRNLGQITCPTCIRELTCDYGNGTFVGCTPNLPGIMTPKRSRDGGTVVRVDDLAYALGLMRDLFEGVTGPEQWLHGSDEDQALHRLADAACSASSYGYDDRQFCQPKHDVYVFRPGDVPTLPSLDELRQAWSDSIRWTREVRIHCPAVEVAGIEAGEVLVSERNHLPGVRDHAYELGRAFSTHFHQVIPVRVVPVGPVDGATVAQQSESVRS